MVVDVVDIMQRKYQYTAEEILVREEMLKVMEIDAEEIYLTQGILPYAASERSPLPARQLDPRWFRAVFKENQRQFLERHGYAALPCNYSWHTIEILVDDSRFTDRDRTIMNLLF